MHYSLEYISGPSSLSARLRLPAMRQPHLHVHCPDCHRIFARFSWTLPGRGIVGWGARHGVGGRAAVEPRHSAGTGTSFLPDDSMRNLNGKRPLIIRFVRCTREDASLRCCGYEQWASTRGNPTVACQPSAGRSIALDDSQAFPSAPHATYPGTMTSELAARPIQQIYDRLNKLFCDSGMFATTSPLQFMT